MYLMNAFQIVPKALLQRDLRFKLLAFIDTVRVFSQILITVLLVFLNFGYWSLVAGLHDERTDRVRHDIFLETSWIRGSRLPATWKRIEIQPRRLVVEHILVHL